LEDKSSGFDLIRTEPGIGYRFVEAKR
jgi:DNA-binding winged helix-turn-helix (wHTH) protein